MKVYACLPAIFIIIVLNFTFSDSEAQKKDSIHDEGLQISQRLENITEANGDVEMEDDYYFQRMENLKMIPINLNTATENELSELLILDVLHIKSLLTYRALMGKFLDLYELQAIPGWSIRLIEKIRPYIMISTADDADSFYDRFRKGHSSFMVRGAQILKKSKGYLPDTNHVKAYAGNGSAIFIRYAYNYKNSLVYGISAEKKAGEQLFAGAQKHGFDFYSAHLFLRKIGIIKSLALGDFVVNMGQGLIQWQSGLAAKKGSEVLNIKRQEEILRPYNSAGKINFHRGAGITIEKNHAALTAFVSMRKLDAVLVFDSITGLGHVTSLITSGTHRTQNELNDAGRQDQFTVGGNINYSGRNFHLGMNGIHYLFKWPFQKRNELYNKYSLTGKKLSDYSIDYSYTCKNIHIFGEAAVDSRKAGALITGLLMSVDKNVSLSFVYRNISEKYQSLYSNAFTENTTPSNERGFFGGVSITPVDILKIEAYYDLFRSPWVKYRTDAPSYGNDFLVQLTCIPNKRVEIYSRYRVKKRAMNDSLGVNVLNDVSLHSTRDWRIELRIKLNPTISIRARIAMNWYDKERTDAENGFLYYGDMSYNPHRGKFSGNAGFEYFETDGYNSRFYTYQHDLSYSYSAPLTYGKGYQCYVNANYLLSGFFTLGMKISLTNYPGKLSIGTGLETINGNFKPEIKLQLRSHI